MPPNTFRVHTENVLIKSVGSKVLWAAAAETTSAGDWRIFSTPPVPCLSCGSGDTWCIIRQLHPKPRCLPERVIERDSGLTPGVTVWGAISYHGRSNLLQREGNPNSNMYIREVLQPEVVPFLQGINGAIFQQDNARLHVAKTVRDFFSAQHMQLLPLPAISPDMLPIEHVWDLVGRRLARDPCPAPSKDELLLRLQAIWNSLPQADIQNLFDSMPRHIAALIVARGGYTKY
ncbi:transposable element Tc1 transposase [Trichonephila clavipes]|nr:transposable element Tc1 transposase [Trichonephila clavipes]